MMLRRSSSSLPMECGPMSSAAPSIKAGCPHSLAARRGSLSTITSAFPSVTGPAYAPFIMGRYPRRRWIARTSLARSVAAGRPRLRPFAKLRRPRDAVCGSRHRQRFADDLRAGEAEHGRAERHRARIALARQNRPRSRFRRPRGDHPLPRKRARLARDRPPYRRGSRAAAAQRAE